MVNCSNSHLFTQVWADNPILKAVTPMTQPKTGSSSSAPGPSQRQRAEQASPQSTSLKRSRSPSVLTQPSPSKLRRLEQIEAGLMSEDPVTPTTPSRSSRFRPDTMTPPPSQHGRSQRMTAIQAVLEPSSPIQTQLDPIDELAHSEMTPTRSSKRARTEYSQRDDEDSPNEASLTPPPSSHRSRYFSATGSTSLPSSQTPIALKLKAKENDSNSDTGSMMWQNDQDDQVCNLCSDNRPAMVQPRRQNC